MAFDYRGFLKTLTDLPGVYQMYDAGGKILYVGKAKNLKKRVSSYFRSRAQNAKTQALVSKIENIQVTLTATEAEALILEHNLIKQQRPPYNILLRDDKSYPYIYLSDETWPRLSFHRGARKKKGRYFGPFPNAHAARETLAMLQKVFRVRQCEDSFFRNRSRPCLQHQIKRCTAPCVELISQKDYSGDVVNSSDFLDGRNEKLSAKLIADMNQAASQFEYERAAYLRDQIEMIRTVQAEQAIDKGNGNIDVLACALDGDEGCIHILFVRQGRIVASRSFYPKAILAESSSDLLSSFLSQHYLSAPEALVPAEVLVGVEPDDMDAQAEALRQHTGRKVSIRKPQRGRGLDWLKIAGKAAEQNLIGRKAGQKSYQRRMEDLTRVFNHAGGIERLECYDISHTQGAQTVASCVVFDKDGPNKKHYRRFNIEGITGGDDYAAMEQVLRRRFTRLKSGEGTLPDMVVIDGGKGQIGKVREVFSDLGVTGVEILGVAKGTTRKSGWERFFLGDDNREIVLDSSRPGFHLLQHIRDEAHRFAITGHKARRDKKMIESPLEDIPGVGPKRRKVLLDHFGGFKGIEKASAVDLAKVAGISKQMAESIYDYFHSN